MRGKTTDLYGKEIIVTELEAAIKQAAAFKAYRHLLPGLETFDRERKKYWSDLHKKLLQLQRKSKVQAGNYR